MRIRTPRHVTRLATCLLATGVLSGLAPLDATRCAASANRRCAECHSFAPHLSHPVGVFATAPVPAHLPLTSGRLTCLTCHDPDTPAETAMLRDPAAALCQHCHDTSAADRSGAHALGTDRAHFTPGSDRQDWRGGDRPDAESESCLSCHDGALARGDALRSGTRRPTSVAAFLDGQHPIGVRQGPRGTGDHLRPAEDVNTAIRLYDGRVGCGSCHSPYSNHDHLLVMSNERSRLCLGCHDL